jgi:protein-disulfide isomerase
MTNTMKSRGFSLSWMLVAGGVLILALSIWLAMAKAEGKAESGLTGEDAARAISASGFSDAEKKGVEAIVHQYLMDNPEVVRDALIALQEKEVGSRVDGVREAMEKPFFGAVIGPVDAPITMVKFTDFNCGYCRSSLPDVDKLLAKNPDVRIVIREAPILTATSKTAALWAFAAAEQGKFPAFQKALFAGGRVTDSTIAKAASEAGLDVPLAAKQIQKGEYQNEIESNLDLMESLGVSGTPTFVVGNEIIEGAAGFDAMQAAVDKARNKKK